MENTPPTPWAAKEARMIISLFGEVVVKPDKEAEENGKRIDGELTSRFIERQP
jgi:hypothetical protein